MSAMLPYLGAMPTSPPIETVDNPELEAAMDAAMAQKGWTMIQVEADRTGGRDRYRILGTAGENQPVEELRVTRDDPMAVALFDDMAHQRIAKAAYVRRPGDHGPETERIAFEFEVETAGLRKLWNSVTSAVGRVVARFRHGADEVEDAVETGAHDVADAVEDTAETAVHEAGEAAEAVVDTGRNVAVEVGNELDEMIDHLTDEARPARVHGDTRLAENREHLRKGGPRPAVTAGHPDSVSIRDRAKGSHLRSVRVVGVRVMAGDSPAVREAAKMTNEAKQRAELAREAALKAEKQARAARSLGRALEGETHPTAEPEVGVVAQLQERAQARVDQAREAFYAAAEQTASSRRLVQELRADERGQRAAADKALAEKEPYALKGVLGHISKATTSAVEAQELAKRTLDRYQEYLPRPENAAVAAQRDALVQIARGGQSRKDVQALARDALRAGHERAGAGIS